MARTLKGKAKKETRREKQARQADNRRAQEVAMKYVFPAVGATLVGLFLILYVYFSLGGGSTQTAAPTTEL